MARAGNIIGGKYRLSELIGEGSMGAVWRAQHETLDRPFAIKLLKHCSDDVNRLEHRFFAEARLAAAVRHRFVVDMVDYGITDEGTPYMVMEYLDGVSLATRLMKGPRLGVRELLRLMHQALSGLDAVHRAGVLHRDLKPENIVLCPDGGDVVAKIVDFGISRELDRPDRGPAKTGMRLTIPGTTLGTPWYMAPEQAQALSTVDQRSDVYAAGIVIYEALAGRLPYDHEETHMVLLMVSAGGAAPLSSHRPDLPNAVSDVIARAMALDPGARFASAAAMANAIEGLIPMVAVSAECRLRGEVGLLNATKTPPLPELGGQHRETRKKSRWQSPRVAPATLPRRRGTNVAAETAHFGQIAAPDLRSVEDARAESGLHARPDPAPLSRAPTLPMALARVGIARMPGRPLLIGAGTALLAGTLAIAMWMRPAGGGPSLERSQARRPALELELPVVVSARADRDGVASRANDARIVMAARPDRAAVPSRPGALTPHKATTATGGGALLSTQVNTLSTMVTAPGLTPPAGGPAEPESRPKRRARRPPEMFRQPDF